MQCLYVISKKCISKTLSYVLSKKCVQFYLCKALTCLYAHNKDFTTILFFKSEIISFENKCDYFKHVPNHAQVTGIKVCIFLKEHDTPSGNLGAKGLFNVQPYSAWLLAGHFSSFLTDYWYRLSGWTFYHIEKTNLLRCL